MTPHPFESRSILVVEDDAEVCRDIVDQLKRSGAIIVGPATNALEALLLLEHDDIDAAVIDLRVDAYESIPVASRLLHDKVPFVFATSEHCSELPENYAGYVVDNLSDMQMIANKLFPPH
jgi:CheY-like chemotaxis protein